MSSIVELPTKLLLMDPLLQTLAPQLEVLLLLLLLLLKSFVTRERANVCLRVCVSVRERERSQESRFISSR